MDPRVMSIDSGSAGPDDLLGSDGGGVSDSNHSNGMKDVSDEEMATSACSSASTTTACCDSERPSAHDHPTHLADEDEEASSAAEKGNKTPQHSNSAAWLCHKCLQMNESPKRCPSCMTWRKGVAKKKSQKVKQKSNGSTWQCPHCHRMNHTLKRCSGCMAWRGGTRKSSKELQTAIRAHTAKEPIGLSSTPPAGGKWYDSDEALAVALLAEEKNRYRRSSSATERSRFEPGGNPNVLDSTACSNDVARSNNAGDSERIVLTEETEAASLSLPTSSGPISPSAAVEDIHNPDAVSSKATTSTDQLQSDAELAAKLAAMYENTPLSAAEKVKYGGRRRGQVAHFKPGGDPRETNPQEEYNLPPEANPDAARKRPRIRRLPGFNAASNPWRKPGRLSKEDEEKLKRNEEATVERLRAIMEGHQQTQNDGQKNIEADEKGNKEGENSVISKPNPQIIQQSFVDLLSEPTRVTQYGVVSLCVSFKPSALALSQQEAIKADSQLRRIFDKKDEPSEGVGCTMTLLIRSTAPRLGLDMDVLATLMSNALFNHVSSSMKADGVTASDSVSIIEELPNMVAHLLLYEVDQEEDRVDSIAVMRSCKDAGRDSLSRSCARNSKNDLKYWADHSLSSQRGLVFLDRLMRPLGLRMQHVEGDKRQEGGAALDEDDLFGLFAPKTENEPGLVVLPFSFLDVLLRCPMIQLHVVCGVIGRVQLLQTEEEDPLSVDNKSWVLQRRLLQVIAPLATVEPTRAFITRRLRFEGTARNTLRQLIELSIPTFPSDQFLDASIASSTDETMKPVLVEVAEGRRRTKTAAGRITDSSICEARSCWANPTTWASSREMQVAIRRERKRLMNDFEKNRQRQLCLKGALNEEGGDKPRRSSRQRTKEGQLIFSEAEMSLYDFHKMKTLLREVNATFRRDFHNEASKPTLSAIRLADEDVQALQDVFFDRDGSLRDECKLDIDSGAKSDPRYIVFLNSMCDVERKDFRWQVPIRHHSIGNEVESRTKVEKVLAKVVVPGREQLDDIGLLFGGLEDQSLHHDTARQLTQWIERRPFACEQEILEYQMISGWEIERLEYNAAMASPYAPGSLLVGLHGGDRIVYLGVQRDFVLKMPMNKCRIKGGRKDEVFSIVRENDHLVVVAAAKGVIFTGDFPHAGVRNFPKHSEQQELMDLLNDKIAAINAKYPAHERVLRTKSYVQMMCNFPKLNKLCRLHCSTEMVNGQISVPHNMIGFDGCYPNVPDRRCFEGDMVDNEVTPVGKPTNNSGTGQNDCPAREKVPSGNILVTPEHAEEAVECDSDQLEGGIALNKESDGTHFIGKRCARGFGGFRFDGTVTEYMPDVELFRIVYDDEDTQEMNLSEVKEAVHLYESNIVNGKRLCTVMSCDKCSQGKRSDYMCRSHYSEFATPSLQSSSVGRKGQDNDDEIKKEKALR